jgi:hypothetical protein
MMVNFTKIIFTELVNTFGLMVEPTMENGLTTKWRVQEPSPGPMVGDIKDSTSMIKNTAKVHLSGQMVVNILVNGMKVNNMVSALISKMARNA